MPAVVTAHAGAYQAVDGPPPEERVSRQRLCDGARLRAYPSRDVTACNRTLLSAYWDRLLALCTQAEVTLYGPWKANDVSAPKATPLFTKAQFQWLPELETYRCPAGQMLKRVGR